MIFDKKVAIIGAGNMGKALLGGILRAQMADPANVIITATQQAHLQPLKERWKVNVTIDNVAAVDFADIIILCVKPQTIRLILDQIADPLDPTELLITIAAGIRTTTITQHIRQHNPVVRVMPNIAALVDEAASAIALGQYAEEQHQQIAAQIFGAVGNVFTVSENLMDAVTGLSGSGPAYIYMVIESLSDGGVKMGLPRELATALAAQTALGAAKLIQETRIHPAVLRDQVTTPGGTTISAIHELESRGLRSMLISAVVTATERSQELSELSNSI